MVIDPVKFMDAILATKPQVTIGPAIVQEDTAMVTEATTPEVTIDSLVDAKIAAIASPEFDFSTISDEVYDKATEAIEDYDFSRKVNDEIDNYMSYEYRFDPDDYDILTSSNFDITDYDALTRDTFDITDYIDTDEFVTDEAFSSFREEIENALQGINGDNAVDPDTLQDTISGIESRLDAIEEAIRSFGGSI